MDPNWGKHLDPEALHCFTVRYGIPDQKNLVGTYSCGFLAGVTFYQFHVSQYSTDNRDP